MRSAHYERLTELVPNPELPLRMAERIGYFERGDGGTRRNRTDQGFSGAAAQTLSAHQSYFGGDLFGSGYAAAGSLDLVQHPALCEAAKRLFGRAHVVPFSLRVNLLLPGQSVALHTDAPHYRGTHADKNPDWLRIAMHHSGLFDDWRVPVATAIAWFGCAEAGGNFVFYPDGPYGRSVGVPAQSNSAIVFDADNLFHGVEARRDGPEAAIGIEANCALRYAGDDAWVLDDGSAERERYAWQDLRFALAWKALCYADADEERKVKTWARELSRERALEVLSDAMQSREHREEAGLDEAALAQRVFEACVKLPPSR
jgi:hypothetical protein